MDSKLLVMKQDEFGDYIGHCPWCDDIFHLASWSPKVKYMNSLIYQCRECGKWVQLFNEAESTF